MARTVDLGPVCQVHKGAWTRAATYEKLNVVRHNGAQWLCVAASSTGQEPSSSSTAWVLSAQDGAKGDKGDTGARGPAGSDATAVVASYDDGTTWYRKYADGWIEQGGKALIAPDGTTKIIFPAAFPAKAYDARAVSLTGAVKASYSVAELTKGGVTFKHDGNGGIMSLWTAKGK